MESERRDPGVGVFAVVEVVDLIEVERSGPPITILLEDRPFANAEFNKLERACADRVLGEVRLVILAEAPVNDRCRIVVEVFRHGQSGLLEVEFDRVIINHLNGAFDAALGHLRLAVLVLLAGVDLFDHAVEQTQGSMNRLPGRASG